MALEEHDPELLRKIHHIRVEWTRLGPMARQAGVSMPLEDVLLRDAPQIVALFDPYGREAVLAAVEELNAIVAAAIERGG